MLKLSIITKNLQLDIIYYVLYNMQNKKGDIMVKYIDIDNVGTILKEEFMDEYKLSMNALANAIGVPANYIHGIVHGTRGISAAMDLRLTRYFGLSEGYFLRLQNRYDTLIARREIPEIELNRIVPILRGHVLRAENRMTA